MATKAIAYKAETAFSGKEILDIEYGTKDYVIWRTTYEGKGGKPHRTRIYYTESVGRAYFKINGHREYIDDYTRCDSPWCPLWI